MKCIKIYKFRVIILWASLNISESNWNVIPNSVAKQPSSVLIKFVKVPAFTFLWVELNKSARKDSLLVRNNNLLTYS